MRVSTSLKTTFAISIRGGSTISDGAVSGISA
jgi:hypothetical protein